MKPPPPTNFAAMILPLLAGGLIVGLLATLTLAAWPAILSQPLAMIDPFWSINPSSLGVYYGYGGFLLASLFTSVLAVGCVLVLGWLGALGFRQLNSGSWLRHVMTDVLHLLSAIPPVAIGGAVALWFLPVLAQTAGYSGRCYLLGIVALVGIQWPRLTLAWLELLDSFSPDLTANARALGARRWHILRWVMWPAMKHRVVQLGLQALVRCLGEAAGIFFVCGASGQTAFRIDLFSNTDTLATRLFAGEEDWAGPHRAALYSMTLSLVVLCLACGFFCSRVARKVNIGNEIERVKPKGFSPLWLLLVLLCVGSLSLVDRLTLDDHNTMSAMALASTSGKTILLLLASTLVADLLVQCTARFASSASVHWLQSVPALVWAIGIGYLLPAQWRMTGVFLSLVLLQWIQLLTEFPRSRHRFGTVLMSMAVFAGELNIFVLMSNTQPKPIFLANLIVDGSVRLQWIPIVTLLGLAMSLALLSRLIYRIFPLHSDTA